MKTRVLSIIFLTFVLGSLIGTMPLLADSVNRITGAGATFPFPVYSRWSYKYANLKGVRVNYQSIGSGGGIRQIKSKTVNFGASDAPLKAEELNKFGLFQFPMVIGGVVPVVHLQGISAGQIKLSGQVLADIFSGTIKTWNDPSIKGLNPKINLPDKNIVVVHRADGSGTTWIFTNYLDKISTHWHKRVGTGKAVDWPTGLGAKGNEGVAAYVQRVTGAIGYVEYAYAIQNKMTYVKLRNNAGYFVDPNISTFQSAASNANWEDAPGFYMVLTDQPGKNSWPITGASFIIIYKKHDMCGVVKAMLSFFDWCYKHGSEDAEMLDYVPIPKSVVKLIEKKWKSDIKCHGKSIW